MCFNPIFMVTKLVTKLLRGIIILDNQGCLEVSFRQNYKNCALVISDNHLEVQRKKGLRNFVLRPFFFSVVFGTKNPHPPRRRMPLAVNQCD